MTPLSDYLQLCISTIRDLESKGPKESYIADIIRDILGQAGDQIEIKANGYRQSTEEFDLLRSREFDSQD